MTSDPRNPKFGVDIERSVVCWKFIEKVVSRSRDQVISTIFRVKYTGHNENGKQLGGLFSLRSSSSMSSILYILFYI